MTLARPSYIDPALAEPTVRYPWDDWNVQAAYMPGDPALISRLSLLSRRAQNGMTIATGEWIVFRLESIDKDPTPKYYLEAAWAGNVHHAYCPTFEFPNDAWAGPIRRPLQLVMALINDALHFEGVKPEENSAWMSQLAELVLPRVDTFHNWQTAVISRLQNLFPAPVVDDDDFSYDWESSESQVPRECFDPAFPFDPAQIPSLIERYLRAVDYVNNPFVSTPADMRAAGVQGVPIP